MENEGNSLLELPLETVEILEEVHIPSDHVGAVSDTNVDNVGEMLIDEGTQSGLSGMETNSIDFEFVNTDLGTGTDFNIDNTSVFGMSDNGIDVREDCEFLFRDSTCFDDNSSCVNKQMDSGCLTHSSMVSIPNAGKLNLYKDLGLKLQVIPLNNLQYVSTIQTSKGLHILAIPSQASLSSNCDDSTIQQLCQKSRPSPEHSVNQSLESRIQTANKFPHTKSECSNSLTKVKAKSMINNTVTVKDTFLSKSTRKLRNSVNKKLIICRNNTLKKGCVQSVFSRNNLVNQTGDKKCLDVLKSKDKRKHRMVSILNKSVTNRLKQSQQMGGDNTSKEIKVTFHLRPPLSGEDKKVVADDSYTKLSSDILEQKSNENLNDSVVENQGTLQTEEDVDGVKIMNPLTISNNEKIVPEIQRNALSEHVNIVDKIPVTDHKEVEKFVEEKSKEDNQVLNRNEHEQSLDDINNKVLKAGMTFAENNSVGKQFQCKNCLTTFSRQGHLKNHMKTHLEIITESKKEVETSANSYKVNSKQIAESKTVKKKPSGWNDEMGEKEKSCNINSEQKAFVSSKIFTCEFCEMSFKTPGNLTRHKLTHSVDVDKKVL